MTAAVHLVMVDIHSSCRIQSESPVSREREKRRRFHIPRIYDVKI